MMLEKAVITASSNKYFPSLINLLGSLKKNYPDHPQVFVYDLGLANVFKKELEKISKVTIIEIPSFCPFWRRYYTWKTYIFNNPQARLNFYLDAGCQVQKSLEEVFLDIDKDGYFLVDQGYEFQYLVPRDYWEKLEVSHEYDHEKILHAGVFGFKADSRVTPVLKQVYEWAMAGLALGYSPQEAWRAKNENNIKIVRDCRLFRHDLTLLNIGFYKNFGRNLKIFPKEVFASFLYQKTEGVYIFQIRLNYKWLKFLNLRILHKRLTWLVLLNRVLIFLLILWKNFKKCVKSFLNVFNFQGC